MNARGLISGLLLIILGLVAGIAYLLLRDPVRSSPSSQVRLQTNIITQIGVRKINSTNYFTHPNQFNWSAVESTNYAYYISNLRSIDCPEATIRDIIVADVAGLYARKRAALVASFPPTPFWRTTGTRERNPLQSAWDALAAEQRQLIRELLQVDLTTELDKYNLDGPVQPVDLGFLGAEKAARVQAILDTYRQREEALHEQATGVWSDADGEALQQLNRQREAELSALLTPEELEEYELRFSTLSNTLRSQLHGFSPTEEEFRQIFRLRQAYDESMAGLTLAEADAGAEDLERSAIQQEQAQRALDGEIQSLLGKERFEQFQKVQEPNFQTLTRVTERFGLPPAVANEAFEHIRIAQEQSHQLLANSSLDPAKRDEALRAIAQETQAAVGKILGPDAFPVFRGAAGRDWLNFGK